MQIRNLLFVVLLSFGLVSMHGIIGCGEEDYAGAVNEADLSGACFTIIMSVDGDFTDGSMVVACSVTTQAECTQFGSGNPAKASWISGEICPTEGECVVVGTQCGADLFNGVNPRDDTSTSWSPYEQTCEICYENV